MRAGEGAGAGTDDDSEPEDQWMWASARLANAGAAEHTVDLAMYDASTGDVRLSANGCSCGALNRERAPSSPARAPRTRADTQVNSKYAGQSLEQIQATITAQVTSALQDLLGADTDEDLDLQAPLVEMGMDSLASVQLVRELGENLGVQLEPTLLEEHPTAAALSGHLAKMVHTSLSSNPALEPVSIDIGPTQKYPEDDVELVPRATQKQEVSASNKASPNITRSAAIDAQLNLLLLV